MDTKRLFEITARFEAARPKKDCGGEELKMTTARHGRAIRPWADGTQILYLDNELCAEIWGNIELQIDMVALAEFFSHALVDVRDLLEEIKRLSNK